MDKRISIRTCIGCNNEFPQKNLVRIVRISDEGDKCGSIVVDTTGRAHGRGAYLCRNPECLDKAFKRKGLERAFRTAVSADTRDSLRESLSEIFTVDPD